VLRPLTLEDAPAIQHLAGAREVAATTLTIPHPYTLAAAEQWIKGSQATGLEGTGFVLGVVLRETWDLIGVVGLGIQAAHGRAEIGYWIGLPYWNKGYCTEAAEAMLEQAFTTLGLNRVYAFHFRDNPASGRVMQKMGMVREGCLRQHDCKWGEYKDVETYGILAAEWRARHARR